MNAVVKITKILFNMPERSLVFISSFCFPITQFLSALILLSQMKWFSLNRCQCTNNALYLSQRTFAPSLYVGLYLSLNLLPVILSQNVVLFCLYLQKKNGKKSFLSSFYFLSLSLSLALSHSLSLSVCVFFCPVGIPILLIFFVKYTYKHM